ncbi:MAG: hypothetical protein JSV03_04865 [Planctomycetota bacterium]|nr:MAG: hypothetical protein JSV03_04865 [Planctomycetota bacterium]
MFNMTDGYSNTGFFLATNADTGRGLYTAKYGITLILILTAATVAAHGWALGDGLFLDDHLHQIRLSSNSWSFKSLLEATTIDPEEFMNTWWQEKPVHWQYTRPFYVLFAKVIYHLSGQSVKSMHAVSIILHLINAFMVHHLCLLLTRRHFWSVVGGMLFVVYSHSIFAVGWLAAQNGVLQTTLLLASLICYIRASDLNLCPNYGQNENDLKPAAVPPLKSLSFILAVFLWCLAIFSRENAIVLPVFIVAFDLAFGGRQYLRVRWKAYLFLAGMALAFIFWRLFYFYQPMPDFYVRRPDGAGYLFWCIAKLMHYLTAVIWLSPMTLGPTGRYQPFIEVPGDCLFMLAILVVLGMGYYLACRRARGYWIWPLWILLSVLPVVPVMATPHSGYFPGVGFAIGMILGPALRDRIKPGWIGRWSPVVALWFLIATTTYIPIYRTLWQSFLSAEQYTIRQIATLPPPDQATDLFFINLPFVNIYTQLHLQEVLERSDDLYQCHVLTYAPNVLRMKSDCVVKQLDDCSFSISVNGQPYFSGALGRFLVEGMKSSGPFCQGDVVSCELFDVQVVRADTEGVRELVFRFHKPLANNNYCFYVTTEQCAAARLKFWNHDEPIMVDDLPGDEVDMDEVIKSADELEGDKTQVAKILCLAANSDNPIVQLTSQKVLLRVVRPVAAALAAPIQELLESDDLSQADWSRIYEWWHRSVDDEVVDAYWRPDNDLISLRKKRDVLFQIRRIAARFIQTDLYMTGPPYPGPR